MDFSLNTHHAYLNSKIVISNNTSNSIVVKDNITSEEWCVHNNLTIRLSAGIHKLTSGDTEAIIVIEDAIKFGGSRIKEAFIFDNSPWVFVVMKDRFYAENIETKEERVEHSISPESIESLGFYNGKPCECFLLRTKGDYSIYNVETGETLITFSNHIFSNDHLVIYRSENLVTVYDFRDRKILEEFDGQYSLGNKFYFIKESKLYGLNYGSSFIITIEKVGEIGEDAYLYDNYLVKLSSDLLQYKTYELFSLRDDDHNICSTEFVFPYYIDSWKGESFGRMASLKNEYRLFAKNNKGNQDFPNVKYSVNAINILNVIIVKDDQKYRIRLYGEVLSYPSNLIMPFTLSGVEGGSIDFRLRVIEKENSEKKLETTNVVNKDDFQLPPKEVLLGKSRSGNLVLSLAENSIIYRNINANLKETILNDLYDASYYINAFFTSDGKRVIFEGQNKDFNIWGFEDLSFDKFDIEGMSVPRRAGFNGYKPELIFIDSRKPVWRDPISLVHIKPEELSDHIFMSPDGNYSAENNYKTIYRNRIEDKDITYEEYTSLCKEYDFNWKDKDTDKNEKIAKRKKLLEDIGKEFLFQYVIDKFVCLVQQSPNIPDYEKSKRITSAVDKTIEDYLNEKDKFTPLFVDNLGYVIYNNRNLNEDNRLLIGRSVYYLNYVSFSYDSRYLAFAAKMRKDDFRMTEDGVFVLYDLIENREIVRQDHGQNLYAVWITMFSKTGNVAYYDSRADAYICFKESGYKTTKKVSGKSLLCFSPSGNYIAFSDQNYIDYTHHPNENWGHQPSGNVFIHPVYNVDTCYEQFNDFGDGIVGVACSAGNVASAAFSSDERRLLAVGDDGVVVVRNLHVQEIEDSLYPAPRVWGNPERPDYRTDERKGFVEVSFWGDDGITTDLVEYWCNVEETLDSEQGLIYSYDGTKLIKSLNIYNEEYNIKDGVKRIENGVFHGIFGPGEGDYNNIKRLYIPDSIEYIGEDVFDEQNVDVKILVNPNKMAEFQAKFQQYKALFTIDPNKTARSVPK